jgi:tetratricopeptide (TPR) repeat protein
MANLSSNLLCAAVALALLTAPSRAADPAQPPTVPAPRPAAPPQAATKAPGPNTALPTNAEERNKLLSNLYAYLATAEDDKQAQPIAQTIERLWLYSGSDTITLLMDRSAKAIGDKNYDLALRFLDVVVDLAPDFAEGWNRRAYVHHLRNDVERMVGDLRRCIALEPNHFRAMEFLGLILRETGQKKAALKAFERLLEINPNTPGVPDVVKELSRDVDGQRT